MTPTPVASRPRMSAGYRIAAVAGPPGLLPWARAEERLTAARNCWVSTTRPDSRPHAVPSWGVWFDGRLCCGTDRRSRTARNLALNPAGLVHLESGDDVVILEGVAQKVGESAQLVVIDDAYLAQYGVGPGEVSVGALRPRIAFTWREQDFPASATRGLFPEDG